MEPRPGGPGPEEMDQLHAEALEHNAHSFEQRLARETDPDIRRSIEAALGVAKAVAEQGGLALVVGGYARDEGLRRLGQDIVTKDIDIEVYGLDVGQLTPILEGLGQIDTVGAAFGVIKMHGTDLDISIPRRDSKSGRGHKGFDIEGDPTMTVREAARRRDFTVNALALNPLTGEIIDEYGGLEDLKSGILRATDPELFGDDPLRVLRAMQFAGRFNMTIEPGTVEICRSLDLTELSVERVGEEWRKLLTKSPRPSVGLEAARQLGVIDQLHPELHALADVPQEPEWHPEGDVWIHTKLVADKAAEIVRRESLTGDDAYVVLLGALCHDLGKPDTTEFNKEKQRITSHGHDTAGVEPAKALLKSISASSDIVAKVLPLVADHLYPALHPDASDTAVRRLARRLHPASIQELVWVAESDHGGRNLPDDGFPQGRVLLEKAERLNVDEEPMKPIVMGRHLIELGLRPGPEFGKILKELEHAQEEGVITDLESGLAYYHQHIAGTEATE